MFGSLCTCIFTFVPLKNTILAKFNSCTKFIYLFYITHVQGGPAKVKPTYMFAGNI